MKNSEDFVQKCRQICEAFNLSLSVVQAEVWLMVAKRDFMPKIGEAEYK